MKRLAIVLSSAALVACGDDWGDKIEAFVDNEVHGLTVAIADNELRVRWFDYFLGLTTKTVLVVEAANKLTDLNTMAVAPVVNFADREKLLALVDAGDVNTVQADRMLRSAHLELSNAGAICESAAGSMHRVDIASLGSRIASQISLPKSDWYVEVSCQFGGGSGDNGDNNGKQGSGSSSGCWKSLVSIVTALFGADKQRQQEDKANAAIARVPQKVISAIEVEGLSKKICKETFANPVLAENLEISRNAVLAARDNTKKTARALSELRSEIDAAQMPVLLQQVRDSSGVERVAQEILRGYQEQYVEYVVDLQRKDLAGFEQRFRNSTACSDSLASAELYASVLEEKRVQLEAAGKVDGPHKGQFMTLLAVVKSAQSALPQQRDERLISQCRKQQ